MNRMILASLALALAAACGKGDAGPQGPAGPTGATGPTGPAGPNATCFADVDCAGNSAGAFCTAGQCGAAPAKPALGATQIDRMGRAGVNTAVSAPFDGANADAKKDAYNANKDPSTWAAAFTPAFEANLAILDSLDAVCGNQLAANTAKTDASRYAALAGVLVDDRLYVNTGAATCNIYLGVEADAVGLAPGNGDCGGRTPLVNSIDSTYQVLAAGTICALNAGVCAISNGITSSAGGGANSVHFPFLGDPN